MTTTTNLQPTPSAPGALGPTVLLVEDDRSIGNLLRAYLARHGYRVLWVRSGEDALAELRRQPVRIVLLDIGLPGIDGFDVCREIRNRSSVPIVMLTARDEEPDRVAGLEVGADDYVSKPFSPRELAARIKAVLRRSELPKDEEFLALEDITLHRTAREVTVAGRPVELSAREFALAEMFLRHPGQVLSREQLLSHVWGYEFEPGSNVVDVYVGYLRKKLGGKLIRTVRGMGYRLDI